MPDRSGYEALPQGDEEADVGAEGLQSPTTPRRGVRRAQHPGKIDLRKLDTAFKRCVSIIRSSIQSANSSPDWKMDGIHCTKDEA